MSFACEDGIQRGVVHAWMQIKLCTTAGERSFSAKSHYAHTVRVRRFMHSTVDPSPIL